MTKSRGERALLELLRAAGIPPDALNATVLGWEVDMVWWQAKLIVEVDLFETHALPGRFARDHRRNLELRRAGWDVIPVDTADIGPLAVDTIRKSLSERWP